MRGSLLACTLFLLVAALLGWREHRQLSSKKEANAKLLAEAAAIATDGVRTAREVAVSSDRLDQRNEELLKKSEVNALVRDYFGLFRDFDEDPKGEANEEFKRLKADIRRRLEALDPSAIGQFMAECYSNPDLNLRIKRDINLYVRTVFISKYPLEMAMMMSDSPQLFGLNEEAMPEGYVQDPFQHLVYYYSYEKKDLQLVFQCLARVSEAFQSKYIGGVLDYYADSPSKRVELLEVMRIFASTPEQVELVNEQLSNLVFGRGEARPKFVELSDWIGSANLSMDELVAATRAMQEKVRVGETGQWLDWLAKSEMPEEFLKERAFALSAEWAEKDYLAAGKWLNSAPESPGKSAVTSAFAAKVYPYNPEVAMQWLQTLPQGPDRSKALQMIYQGIQQNGSLDRTVDESFARKHGLKE